MKSEVQSLISSARVLQLLRSRKGAAEGMTAKAIVTRLTGRDVYPSAERHLRHVVEELRLEGYPISAHPSRGYFIATSDADLEMACAYLHARAMTSLQQIAAMRRVSLPDLLGQLRLSA